MEKWKKVRGWEKLYEVSSTGRVRSFDKEVRAGRGGAAVRKGRVLSQILKQGRYLCVTLADGEKREQHLVHRLVAAAFLGRKPCGLQVLHTDDDKLNNAASNLRYGTHADNMRDRSANGGLARGEKHGCAKLTERVVRRIRKSKESPTALATKHSIHPTTVWAIRSGKTWRHVDA